MSSSSPKQLAQRPNSAGETPSEEEIVFESIDEQELDEVRESPSAVKKATKSPEAAPAWFRRNREGENAETREPSAASESPDPKPIPPPLPNQEPNLKPQIRIEKEQSEEVDWPKRISRWILSAVAAGYGISLLLHFAILLLMSLSMFLVDGMIGNEPINTAFSEDPSDGEETQFVEIINTKLDVPEIQTNLKPPAESLPISNLRSSESTALPSDLEQSIAKMVAVSGKSVTKGSFTAWTIPEDPEPGQDYKIVIQVAVPKNVKLYKVGDLSGYVIGTDNFVMPIGAHDGRKKYKGRSFPKRVYGRFDFTSKQLVVSVMGAAEQVKDTIHIESKLLKESQDLEIVF